MKFMHISDVHLGVKPDAGKAWSEKRAQDIWDSFAEMIEIAAEESPDFLAPRKRTESRRLCSAGSWIL